eukprot:gnl/MRDRNA2_/MRDRNA2_351250_c0_seq1.p2 gnl/MRDRNA2_/MRDRNA2_351250_c0~~gnl/MRDRNA2_/MRDRNA2_351250_c0_seq1.p2  ORF type:complete len:159 (-),score=13.49 gnl/MRDRNA2_/MRDRNA2_351250_c0_seq1:110-586(-)
MYEVLVNLIIREAIFHEELKICLLLEYDAIKGKTFDFLFQFLLNQELGFINPVRINFQFYRRCFGRGILNPGEFKRAPGFFVKLRADCLQCGFVDMAAEFIRPDAINFAGVLVDELFQFTFSSLVLKTLVLFPEPADFVVGDRTQPGTKTAQFPVVLK